MNVSRRGRMTAIQQRLTGHRLAAVSPGAPIWSLPDVTSEAHLESLPCQSRRFRVPAQPAAPYAVYRRSIHQARA